MKYFTADWHWGDDRFALLGRPYNDTKVAQAAALAGISHLTADDELFVVGDAAISEEWLEPLLDIKAVKHLVKGNYDRLDDETYLKYFTTVSNGIEATFTNPSNPSQTLDTYLVHYPAMGKPDRFNLTAHIHGCWRVQKNMLNVGVDVHYMLPLTLDKLFFFFNGICNFYDQDVWVGDNPANLRHKDRGKAGTYWQSGFLGTRDNLTKTPTSV